MATMVITTRDGSVELSRKATTTSLKKELNLNLQSAQLFLTKIQAKIEQMSLKSDEDRNAWNNAFTTFETQIPNALNPEVKEVLKMGLTQIQIQMKPETAWEMMQDIHCALDCTVRMLEASYS